jgi:adducin
MHKFESEKLKRSSVVSLGAKSANFERTEEENSTRIELAAAYRLVHMFGWEELIYNHITCRIHAAKSNEPERFLINPYGMGFDEVTASSLITVDTEGNVIDSGTGSGRVNAAGFLIHSAVHEARKDAHCVIHVHQEDVVAVGARPEGLVPVGQAYYALGEITKHDYEGLALLENEKESIVRDLGERSKVMILKNHGCVTLGSTVAEAFIKLYFLVRACQQQVKAGPTALLPRKHVQEMATEQAMGFNAEGFGVLEFAYLKRKLERLYGVDYKR